MRRAPHRASRTLFNAPVPVDKHELQAICMAPRMHESMAALAQGWKKHGYDLRFSVAIAGGYATIGAIVYGGRFEYSAIGTVVYLAARLCGEAGVAQILISPRIFSKTEGYFDVEPVGDLSLKGFNGTVPA